MLNILKYLPRLLIKNERPSPSQVIIALSGDSMKGRIEHAVRLYNSGFGGKILLCGKTQLSEETGINLMEKYALLLGVPPVDILVESRSSSTMENALFCRNIIGSQNIQSVIVVTSPLHTKRAWRIFTKVLPKDVRVQISCDEESFEFNRWWREPRMTQEVFDEYLKFVFTFISERSNTRMVRAKGERRGM